MSRSGPIYFLIFCHCIQYRNEITHLGKTVTNTDCITKETFSSITENIFPVQETPWNSNVTLDSSLEVQCSPAYRCLSSLLALCCKAAFVRLCHKSKGIFTSFVDISQYCWHELCSQHCLWAFYECSPAASRGWMCLPCRGRAQCSGQGNQEMRNAWRQLEIKTGWLLLSAWECELCSASDR